MRHSAPLTLPQHLQDPELTWLFVPANRPERYSKALSSGADAVIVDLEDAVGSADKDRARQDLEEFLVVPSAPVFVRINDSMSEHYAADVAMLNRVCGLQTHALGGVILPKAEEPELVQDLRSHLAIGVRLVAIIESALGIHNIHALAGLPGLERLAFGAVDYSVELDLGNNSRALDHARSTLVLASKVAGLPAPVDAPSLAIKDQVQLDSDAQLSRDFGFGGKLCIHPSQLGVVAAAFAPNATELAWAQRVIELASEGAAQLDGKMIDRPVIEQAKKMLARALPTEQNGKTA